MGILPGVASAALVLVVALSLLVPPAALADGGSAIWSRQFSSGRQADEYLSVAAGPSGSIYVTGVARASEESSVLLLAKYTDAGTSATRSWVHTFTWPGTSGAAGSEVAVDANGDVLVAGTVGAPPYVDRAGRDILVLKYAPDGALKWARRYDGPAGRDDYNGAMALDGSGNVYVIGTSRGAGTGKDYVVLKYRGDDGRLLWVERYGGPGTDEARAVVADGRGNVFVTGSSRGSDGIAAATLKLSPSGHLLWVLRLHAGVGITHGSALALSGGSVLVAGDAGGDTSTRMQLLVARVSTSSGAVRWSELVGNEGDELALDIAADSSGNAVAIGQTSSRTTAVTHGLASRVHSGGALDWTHEIWLGNVGDEAGLQTVAVGGGSAYVGGFAAAPPQGDDFLVRRLANDGTILWTYTRNGSASGIDLCRDLALTDGAVYAAGLTTSRGSGGDALLVKIAQ